MEETRVNFETASLAKEKGFDEECRYHHDIEFRELTNNHDFEPYRSSEIENGFGKLNYPMIATPTQTVLQTWLRETYKIHVTPRESYAFDNTLEYVCTVNDIYVSHNNPKLPINRFPSWEEALEIGLQEGLNLIKE